MRFIYDSSRYSVAEFPGHEGIELLDKRSRRSGFIAGAVEDRFRALMRVQINDDPSDEALDEFIGCYEPLMTLPAAMH